MIYYATAAGFIKASLDCKRFTATFWLGTCSPFAFSVYAGTVVNMMRSIDGALIEDNVSYHHQFPIIVVTSMLEINRGA